MNASPISIKFQMINLHFNRVTGKKSTVPILPPVTREKLKKILIELYGSDQYRLVIKGQELSLDNEEEFQKRCELIQNGSMIYVLQRMKGGSKFADVDTQRAIILSELPNELEKVPTDRSSRECSICLEETICYQVCCTNMCKICFIRSFVHCEYKFLCSVCNKLLNYQKFFTTPQFIT